MIAIINYESDHQVYFEKLNRAWIEKYFEMEPTDDYVLTNPEEAILKNCGAILMAVCDGVIAGTVALRKINNDTFEFTKMAVDEPFRRRGIAEKLSYASFEKAKALNADKVILYSNSLLKNAIHLYEKIGFRHIPVGDTAYKRSDVKMEITLAELPEQKLQFFQ